MIEKAESKVYIRLEIQNLGLYHLVKESLF